MKKKVFSKSMAWILSVAMMFGVFVAAPTTVNSSTGGHTQDEAVAWARSQIGNYLDYDGAYGCQCVDLIAYYYQYLGTRTPGGNGCDYSHNTLPDGWVRIENTPTFVPEPGDIVVWTDGGWRNGHVAIFLSGDTHSFTSIDQNWPQGTEVTEVYHSNYNYVWGVIRPDFEPGHNPIGFFDGVDSPAPNKINVSGWAFDWDNLGKQLDIHVYVGGPAGSGAPCYVIKANTYRPDVEAVYPGVGAYHGYDDTITVGNDRTGNQAIYVYAINVDGGWDNPLLDNSPKTVNIQKDTSKPVISNVKVTEVSESGYRVTCNVSDNVGVTSVKFPTWTGNNGQDDLIWHNASISGNTATLYIKSSEHKNETGTYYTDIYAYDGAGNGSGDVRATIPQLKPYVVKYNLNGGSGSFPDQKRYYNGAAIKLNSAKPTKTGYSFVCWNTKSDGTGTKYNPGDSYSANADLTLYAIWKANTYTIAYNANGGTGTINSSTVTFGQGFAMPNSGFAKAGYTLTGFNAYRTSDNTWFVQNQGWVTESQIKDGNTKKLYGVGTGWYLDSSWVNSNATDTYTFYAVWKINTYTISYSLNGGVGDAIPSQTKTYGQDVTLSNVVPEQDGYVFDGWSIYSFSATGEYKPGSIYTAESNVVLYAIWKPDKDVIEPKAKGTYNGHTYEYYDQPMNWHQAYQICERKGGHLATITSKEENDFLSELTKGANVNAWIGAKTNDFKTWVWLTGEPFEYQNWSDTEPNNASGHEEFLEFYTAEDGSNGKWNDLSPENFTRAGFICEYGYEVDPDDFIPACSTVYNGHEYWFFDNALDWLTADRLCKQFGGHLVIIDNSEENEMIRNILQNTINKWSWIGVNDVQKENVWVDVFGKSLQYTNWADGEPNNYTGVESFAIMYHNGLWYDYRGFGALFNPIGFVCEFEGLCSVSYDMNGGTGTIESQPKTYGQDLTLSSTKPTRTGYSFLGWSTDKNAVKAQYQPGGTYTENKNVTLYAVWKEKTYIITYYMNDGTDTIFKKVTNQGIILSTVPTREGYEFIGWNTQSNATTAQYQPNDTLSSIQNMSLYAVWKEKQTVIPGDINGDGKVNMKDATRLHQYINGWDVSVVEAAIDVNGDGKVNMKDVTRLHQYINGWDVKIYVK